MAGSVDEIAASMSARARAHEVLANNLANVNTSGFKRMRVAFARELDRASAGLAGEELAPTGSNPPIVLRAEMDRSSGVLAATGRPSDVAVRGPGFLVVQTPDGERYTRDGALTLNTDGEIADRHGHPILGDGGPLSPGTADFHVTDQGLVMAAGGQVGRLRVVDFEADTKLRPIGGGLLATETEPQPIDSPRLAPGHREQSNVEPLDVLVSMMESYRLYEASSDVLRSYDELMERLLGAVERSVR